MVALDFEVNPNDTSDFPLLADGDYPATIANTEVRQSKSSNNSYLQIEFALEPQGRVWHNLNLWNTNDDAVRIAKQELNGLCKAVNFGSLQDTDQLHGRRLLVTVGTQPPQGEYRAKNIARGFKPIDQSSPPAAQAADPAPPTQPQPEAAAPASPPAPWNA